MYFELLQRLGVEWQFNPILHRVCLIDTDSHSFIFIHIIYRREIDQSMEGELIEKIQYFFIYLYMYMLVTCCKLINQFKCIVCLNHSNLVSRFNTLRPP